MARIIGLTDRPTWMRRDYPLEDLNPRDNIAHSNYLNMLGRNGMAFYIATGEMFNANERWLHRFGHKDYWWYLDSNYYPYFDKNGIYQYCYVSYRKVEITDEIIRRHNEWLKS